MGRGVIACADSVRTSSGNIILYGLFLLLVIKIVVKPAAGGLCR